MTDLVASEATPERTFVDEVFDTLPPNWKLCTVGQLVDEGVIAKPLDGNHGEIHPKGSDFVSSGIPFVMATDINHGQIDLTTCKFISPQQASTLSKGFAVRGDVLLTHKASLGRTAVVGDINTPYIMLTPQVTYYRVLDSGRLSNQFLKYFFDTPVFQETLRNHGDSGSTRAYIGITAQRDLPVVVPKDVAEQRAIAGVLSNLDEKIDLLRSQNQTLEAMAETLFREWFAASIHETERVCPIDALIAFNPTRSLAKGAVAPYVEMAALSETTFNPEGWYDRPFSSGMKFVNGDTLLARITPCLENGKTAYITFLEDGQVAWGSTEYIVMRPRGELHPLFAYALARHSDFRDHAEGCLAGSSGRQRVELEHLRSYEVRSPSPAGIAAFNRMAAVIEPKLHANAEQIRTLRALRDNLLPKLMSGEVRVTC